MSETNKFEEVSSAQRRLLQCKFTVTEIKLSSFPTFTGWGSTSAGDRLIVPVPKDTKQVGLPDSSDCRISTY